MAVLSGHGSIARYPEIASLSYAGAPAHGSDAVHDDESTASHRPLGDTEGFQDTTNMGLKVLAHADQPLARCNQRSHPVRSFTANMDFCEPAGPRQLR